MTEFEDYEAALKELAALNEMPDTSRDELRARLEAYLAEKKRGFVLCTTSQTTEKSLSSPKARRPTSASPPIAKSAAHPWRKGVRFGKGLALTRPT